jgi:uncharacterized repeat protein (TIGR02543 family)
LIDLPNPIIEGYEFLGWYMDKELTIPYDLVNMPSNNIILYALFTKIIV